MQILWACASVDGNRTVIATGDTRRIDESTEHEISVRGLELAAAVALAANRQQAGHHSRNVCIFASGELDRSPTGSGVSARAALHHARGDLRVNEKITIESILGSTMTVHAADLAKFGSYDAVIPLVGGTPSITGRNAFYFDPEDSLVRGFNFR